MKTATAKESKHRPSQDIKQGTKRTKRRNCFVYTRPDLSQPGSSNPFCSEPTFLINRLSSRQRNRDALGWEGNGRETRRKSKQRSCMPDIFPTPCRSGCLIMSYEYNTRKEGREGRPRLGCRIETERRERDAICPRVGRRRCPFVACEPMNKICQLLL
jgi:hypothetical protein